MADTETPTRTLAVWHPIRREVVDAEVVLDPSADGAEPLTNPFYGRLGYDPELGGTTLTFLVGSSYVRAHEHFASTLRPEPGDIVACLTDDYYSSNGKTGSVGYVDTGSGWGITWPDVHVGLGITGPHMRPGDPRSVSLSGGPFVTVDGPSLVYLGHQLQRFWTWGPRGVGAGNGTDYYENRPVWGWDGRTASETRGDQ